MININQIRQSVYRDLRKDRSGNPLKPSEFGDAVYDAAMRVFHRHKRVWEQTQTISELIGGFLKGQTISFVDGIAEVPEDYLHFSSITGLTVEVEGCSTVLEEEITDLLRDDQFIYRKKSTLIPPSITRPICRKMGETQDYPNGYLQLLPKSITSGRLHYLRKIARPVWGYNLVNGDPVYDPATSVDLECFREDHIPLIVDEVLVRLGITLREAPIVQGVAMERERL